MSRFNDNIPLVPVGSIEPTSVPSLLRHLGLTDAPREEQEAGISAWLADHDVVPLMDYGLRRSGFGPLLDELGKSVISRMDGGELQTVREYLGLTLDQLGGLLRSQAGRPIAGRQIRSWESGSEPIPDRIRVQVEQIETDTAAAVGQLVDALNAAADPAVLVYRSDADMHAARPDCAHLPARWWRMVVARAVQEVPGVPIATAL